ncbi:hypothetical protein Goshw_023771 [Gossypium schwendimanii]|uniref:CCHC-type domain-containing protein n=1 Tax=Gossypium schwendimanii TaxID=34291 RepID=A0A7J9MRF3_GOSSC|nr:hypothetical protein [Gossypium schwendimanii]
MPVAGFVIGVNLVGSNTSIGHATKKVRRWPDLLSNTDDPTVEENERKLPKAVMAKVSYKNTLIRSLTTSDSPQNVEDFELQEGDVMTEMIDGIPSINFFERVHKFIERKMATAITVKLLGQKIAFNALLSKVMMLWNSKHPFQLIDLENDYYLVCFNDEEDYNNVLTSGPWVILGQYLTFRLWSPTLMKILIKGMICSNGKVQRIEYESLPKVCFCCGIYGHSSDSCPKNRPSLPMNDTAHSSLILKIHDL